MAEEIGDAYVNLGVRDAEYNAKMAEAHMTLKKFGAAVTGGAAIYAATYAAVTVARLVSGSRVAAEKSEQATMDLGLAIKFSGQNIHKVLPAYEAFADQIQKTTAFDDEAVRSAMALGLSLGIAGSKIEEATEAAIGMSAVTGGDLQSSMLALVKGNVGVIRQLKMFGVEVDENASKEQNFNAILRQTGQLFQIAEARANTTSGSFKKISNAWSEIQEKLGRGINSLLHLDTILPAISKVLSDFGMGSGDVEKVTKALQEVEIKSRESAKVVEETEKKKQEAIRKTMSVMSAKELWNKLAEAGLRFIPPKAMPASTGGGFMGPVRPDGGGYLSKVPFNQQTGNVYVPNVTATYGAAGANVGGGIIQNAPPSALNTQPMVVGGPMATTLMPSMQRAMDSDGGLKISDSSIKKFGGEVADRWKNTVFE